MSLGLFVISPRGLQLESYFRNNRIYLKFLSISLHSHSQPAQPCLHCSGALHSDYGNSSTQNPPNKSHHPHTVSHSSQNFYRRELKAPAIAVCSAV